MSVAHEGALEPGFELVDGLVDVVGQARVSAREQPVVDRVQGREVLVDRGWLDAHASRNLSHGDRAGAALLDNPFGVVEQFLDGGGAPHRSPTRTHLANIRSHGLMVVAQGLKSQGRD